MNIPEHTFNRPKENKFRVDCWFNRETKKYVHKRVPYDHPSLSDGDIHKLMNGADYDALIAAKLQEKERNARAYTFRLEQAASFLLNETRSGYISNWKPKEVVFPKGLQMPTLTQEDTLKIWRLRLINLLRNASEGRLIEVLHVIKRLQARNERAAWIKEINSKNLGFPAWECPKGHTGQMGDILVAELTKVSRQSVTFTSTALFNSQGAIEGIRCNCGMRWATNTHKHLCDAGKHEVECRCWNNRITYKLAMCNSCKAAAKARLNKTKRP